MVSIFVTVQSRNAIHLYDSTSAEDNLKHRVNWQPNFKAWALLAGDHKDVHCYLMNKFSCSSSQNATKIRTTFHKSTEMIDLFTVLTAFLVNVINESHYHIETKYTNQLNLTYWNKVMPNGIRSWSSMVQVMACSLTAPSHYLRQYWPTINMIIWHSFQANVYLNTKI